MNSWISDLAISETKLDGLADQINQEQEHTSISLSRLALGPYTFDELLTLWYE